MENVLDASSMLLAVLALLFGVWHQPIGEALSLKVSGPPENLLRERGEILAALWTKALPLAAGGVLTVLVFGERTLGYLAEARSCARGGCSYDDVKAAFLLTQLFALLIAAYVSLQAEQLRRHHRKACSP